ncbi:HMGN1 protein, partial [Crocuta crocuta]
GCGRSGYSQAAQPCKGSLHPVTSRHRACICRTATMPTRKISSAEGVAKEPKRKLVRFSTKPAPANVEKKPKKEEGKDTLQTKKKKGKRKAKGKQAEVANQETKRDLPTQNGKSKNGSLAFDEAGEKEAKSG